MSWAISAGSRAGGGATLKDTCSMSGPGLPATSFQDTAPVTFTEATNELVVIAH